LPRIKGGNFTKVSNAQFQLHALKNKDLIGAVARNILKEKGGGKSERGVYAPEKIVSVKLSARVQKRKGKTPPGSTPWEKGGGGKVLCAV